MLANRTVNLLRSVARRLPSNGFAIRLVSDGSRAPPPIAVTAPPPVLANAQPREAQMQVNPARPALEELSVALDQGRVPDFVQMLKAMANSETRPPSERLVELMDKAIDRVVKSKDVADWLSSLGKLGFQASIPKQRALIIKSVQQLCRTKGMNSIGMSMSLDALTKTGLQLSHLPPDQRVSLLRAIDQTAAQFAPRELANVLKALGKLGEGWSEIPTIAQQTLLQSLEKNAGQMESFHAALALHSFGQLELDINTLTDEQRQLVFQVATKGMNVELPDQTVRQICQQNAMVILGLGKIGAKHASLSVELAAHMKSCLLHTLSGMDGQQVSNVIYAFGLMGCSSSDLSELEANLQSTATAQIERMSLQGISMTLHGLANMGTKWIILDQELRNIVMKTLGQPSRILHNDGNAHAVASSVSALGKVGAPWKSFNPAFRTVLLNVFILLQGKFKPQEVSNFIYGLGCMGTPFQDLSPTFIMAVQKAVHRLSGPVESFKSQELSIMLLGLADMRASWFQLPAKELEHLLVTLAPSMTAQGVANSVYGLAVIDASWQALSSETIRALASAFEAIAPATTSQGVANSMHGLTLMCFDFQPTSTGSSSAELEKEQLMWKMIRALVKRFKLLGRDEYGKEDITQFAIFFEWLSGLPGGMELITEELGSRPAFRNPSGIQARSPLHLALSRALPKALQKLEPAGQFHIVNRFDGLGGPGHARHVFDMDMAVHQDGKLIAFVEVDMFDKQLVRGDLLKKLLYRRRFPGVPLHRTCDTVAALNVDNIALRLAQDICKGTRKGARKGTR